MKQRRYYEVGEKVWVKPYQTIGKIVYLDIKPEEKQYKADIEFKNTIGELVTKTFNLWEINKDKREYYKNLNRNILHIPVKYFDEDVEKLQAIEIGDWIDLRSRVDVELGQLEFALVPLNIAMQLPEGYEAHIVPRSSTYKNWGILQTNSMGVIDNSYAGNDDEWLFPALSVKGGTHIKKGDRICQFRITKKMDKDAFRFKTVDELLGSNRGGFGSTGKQ